MIELARHLLREYMHPREFFGKAIKNLDEVQTDKRTFKVDTMPKKEFYLKIKIANLRKTLVENRSLNEEMCLDPIKYPDLWNVKQFIRALEDIAEVEQERLCDEKKANVPASPGSSPPKSDIPKQVDALQLGNAKVVSKKKEPRSPQQAPKKFGALITIDEAVNETVTSQQVSNSVREDSQLAISSHMRNSRLMDFEESIPTS